MRAHARIGRSAVVAVTVASVVVAGAGRASAAVPGTPDTSWNGTGVVQTSVAGIDEATGVAVQPDGRVVVAGQAQSPTGAPVFALARYLGTGAPDPSFGTGGIVLTPPFFADSNGDIAHALALEPDGDIVVAGSASHADGTGALAVARYLPSGALDTGFGTGGQATVVVGSGVSNSANAVAVQSDGAIVLAGSFDAGWAVTRLTAAGALDTGFDADGPQPGVQAFDLGDPLFDTAYAVAVQGSGSSTRIVVGGNAANNPGAGSGAGNEDAALVAFDTTGHIDHGFGTGGFVRADLGGNADQVSALAIAGDGSIVAAAQAGDAGGSDHLTLLRLTPAGVLDPVFGAGGIAPVAAASSTDPSRGLAVLPDGSVLAAATASSRGGDVEVVKVGTTGALDPGFGSGGIVSTDVAQDRANALAVDPASGRIVVAGGARTDATHEQWLVTAYTGTPAVLLPQTITFTSTPPAHPGIGGTSVVTATGGGSGNPVVFSATAADAGICTITAAGHVVFTGAGTCVVAAHQAGGNGYAKAKLARQRISVVLTQSITFDSMPPTHAVPGGTYQVAAHGGGSGNPVTFAATAADAGVCTVTAGGAVGFVGAGSCVIKAHQAGTAAYLAANAQQKVRVFVS